MKVLVTISVMAVLLWGCSGSVDVKGRKDLRYAPDEEVHEVIASSTSPATGTSGRKVINRVGYSVRVMPALDFLARKGEQVSSSDKESLSKEMVALLEIDTPDAKKDFFDAPELAFSKEEGLQYLVGGIGSDITLLQDSREFYPSGVSFERVPGLQHRIRVLLFFSDVDPAKKMRISYYDRLMDSGMINFGINS